MPDNHDVKSPSPEPQSGPSETTEGKERQFPPGRSSRSSFGSDRGADPADAQLNTLPVPLSGTIELLTQIATTAGDMQLDVLSRKGLRIASLPVSQNQLLFGLSIDGLFFVDRSLDQTAPTIAALLRRFQQQQILQPGREEFPRPEVLEQERAALLDLTARGLRSLANRLGSSPVRVKQRPPGTTLGASANLRFSPIELLLNRPEGLSLHDDVTTQLFHNPPQGTTDSWLFLINSPGQLWPVATINVGLKSLEDASTACQNAHNLLRFMQRQGVTLSEGTQHAICLSGDGFLLLLIVNSNQAVLLTLPAAQLGRVLQIAQQNCIQLVTASVAKAPVSAQSAAPASPAVSAAPASPAVSAAPIAPLASPAAASSVDPVAATKSVQPAVLPKSTEPASARSPQAVAEAIPSATSAPHGSNPQSEPSAPSAAAIGSAVETSFDTEVTPLYVVTPPVEALDLPELEDEAEPIQETTIEVPEQLSTGPVLCIRHLQVMAGSRTLIKDLELDIPGRGVFALMGPGGAGKSTLLGVLAGGIPGLYQSGELTYRGRVIDAMQHPLVIGQRLPVQHGVLIDYLLGRSGPHAQKQRLLAAELLRDTGLDRLRAQLDQPLESMQLTLSQAWRIEILHALSEQPALLCVDEPTAAMEPEDAEPILNLLRQIGTQRAVLFVTHNQAHAQSTASRIALMAAARLQAVLPSEEFFAESAPSLVRDYVRTGGCHVPSPDAPVDHIDPDYLTPPQATPSQVIEPDDPQEPPPAQILWAHPQPVLTMRKFGLSMGERCRLSRVDLDISERGTYLLICQDGTIRRLLQSYLATGLPGKITTEGEIKLRGEDLSEDNHAASIDLNVRLLMSSVREYLLSGYSDRLSLVTMDEKLERVQSLLTQQKAEDLIPFLNNQVLDLSSEQRRRLAIARAVSMQPAILCLEEPCQGLNPEDSAKVLAAIAQESQRRAVLMLVAEPITAWQDSAHVGYVHGEYLFGSPQEQQSVSEPAPIQASVQTKIHVETVPAQTVDSASSATEVSTINPPLEAPVSPSVPSDASVSEPEPVASNSGSEFRPLGKGPRGFHWLIPGVLAGTPEPGMMHDLDYDLSLLHAAGITLLVTLTETPLDDEALAAQGLKNLFFPIVDMHAPSLRAAYDLCGLIDLQLSRGERIAFHCKAGLGRTGTLLCSYLIWKGEPAEAALRRARRVEPAWVQSKEQEKFLSEYEGFCSKQKQTN